MSEVAELAPANSTPFAKRSDIKLGMIVRDPATGLVGQCDRKSDLLSGTTQYAIQPQGDGKTIPESFWVDDFILEFVDKGISDRVPPIDKTDKYALGQKLEDLVTGYVGMAVQRTTYLNGCVHYALQRHINDVKGKALIEDVPQGSSFDHKRLKFVNDGVATIKKDGKAVKSPKSTSGGPTLRAPGRSAGSRSAA